MEKICENCRFFNKIQNKNIGECRKYAPRYLKVVQTDWAVVCKTNWCGEFEKKETD
jgi:hypothetical protein